MASNRSGIAPQRWCNTLSLTGLHATPPLIEEQMHNSFITTGFDWMVGGSTRLLLANELLGKIGSRVRLRAPTSTGYMSSIEMRGNLYHLVSQILAYDVPGEIVEFGSFAGESAVLMATVVK